MVMSVWPRFLAQPVYSTSTTRSNVRRYSEFRDCDVVTEKAAGRIGSALSQHQRRTARDQDAHYMHPFNMPCSERLGELPFTVML